MSAPEYTQDYVTDPTDNARQVAAEVQHHATDFDPGNQTAYPGSGNWGGMPDGAGTAAQQVQPVPETFDQANPQLSYTRARPQTHATYVRTLPARTIRVRNLTIPIVGDPILILAKNASRWKALLSAASLGIFVADDPAALQGLSATSSGNGFPLPLTLTYESVAELYAMAITAPITLGIMEYIDN